MNRFIMIDNKFFNITKEYPRITPFYQIGTEGFTIYSYILIIQGGKTFAQLSIKDIQVFLNRDINKKKKSKEGLRDKRTILKYLLALKRENS